ncbi:hypothetical protein Q1695_011371 [Nippostrongylus brasiliensis]|nr:hypothetical protein Q1695_011371 [Nippostrongylus brasiliensis]
MNTIVAPDGIYFPDITLCNSFPFKASKLAGYGMSEKVQSYVLAFFNDHVSVDDFADDRKAFEDFVANYQEQTKSNFSIVKFFEDVRFTCEDMVIGCSFAGENIANCCQNAEIVAADVGYCIRFPNELYKKRQFLSGSSYGWQFILDGNNRYTAAGSSLSFSYGFYVALHEPNKEVPIRSQALSVPPAAALHAGISVKNTTLLQRRDWGLCELDWNAEIHGPLLTDLQYTSTHCEWNCLGWEWLRVCDCLPIKLLSLGSDINATICSPIDINRCADVVYDNANKCNCDVECEKIDYETQISYSDVLPDSIQRRFNLTEQYIDDNISVLNLYLRSITYERHEQQKQLQTADLLSNIAGSMGLFLGMSTVTLLEIFIYLFKSVWGTVNTERQKQFMEAMLEEENERRQSVLIVEEPIAKHSKDEDHDKNSAPQSAVASRRISVVPVHVHMDRRGSSVLPLRDSGILPIGSAPRYSVFSPGLGSAPKAAGRRSSTIESTFGSILPSFHSHHRKSIAVGTLGRRESFMPGSGEILPTRRGSVAVPQNARRPSIVITGASGARLAGQPNDDAIHLMVNRRRSSVHPKHFLI